MTVLIQACNDARRRYNISVKRFKKQEYTVDDMLTGQAYYLVVICLLMDSKNSRDHIVVISHGWIFDSRFKYTFGLSLDNLHYICGANEECYFVRFHEQIQIKFK